ncbi:MAG: OmpA family protein [Gammaproteobacteria bacterium]|nr:OmpA family protein [Gammaproteobacteria bacterium]
MNKLISLKIKLFTLTVIFLCFQSSALALSVISEKITFLNENGIDYVRYDTTRTSHHSYDIWFKKEKGQLPEQHLKDYLYLYPNQYQWDSTMQPGHDLLRIASGSYATLVQSKLKKGSDIRIGDDGVYTYSNWDGKTIGADNHYGIWNKPDHFSQLVYAWVFPENFNIISYQANRGGKWVKRNNTITYYGKDVNDLVFTIKYQPRSNTMFRDLVKLLNQQQQEQQQIQLEQSAKGVKITLAATVLFASGSSELSHSGRMILQRVARALSKRNDIKVIVEGHSDNNSIKGSLEKKFKTNWELSAMRSLNVLHYMAENNIPESRLESRAYGSTRPIASNASVQGRAQNRRIEIVIMDVKY